MLYHFTLKSASVGEAVLTRCIGLSVRRAAFYKSTCSVRKELRIATSEEAT